MKLIHVAAPYIMMTLNFDIRGFRPSVLKFPSAEKFSEVAKFIGTKFSSSESINFTADISKAEWKWQVILCCVYRVDENE